MHIDVNGEETKLIVGDKIKGDPNSYGHSSLIISRGGKSVAYDFGRYGSAKPSNGLMKLLGINNSGLGILRKWKNGDAYLKDQSKNRDQTVYTFNTSKAEEAKLQSHFDQLEAEGQKKGGTSQFTTTQTKDDYALTTNSCVTQSAGPLSDSVGTKDEKTGEGFNKAQGLIIDAVLSPTLSPSGVKSAADGLVTAGLATKTEIPKREPKKE